VSNGPTNAIVSGREDFLYSSTWLARIARNLQAANKNSHGVLMLGANLQFPCVQKVLKS